MKKENNAKTTSVFLKSEFWTAALTAISGLLLAFGIVTPTQASAISAAIPQIVGALLTIFSTTKFINVQHEAKVEVFRAMCAMRIENAGKVTAQGLGDQDNQIMEIAKMAGL